MTDIVKDMKKRGIFLSKRRGQCLLRDESVWNTIFESASIKKSDIVLDIGSGPGYSIARIAPLCGYYIGVEIDRKCVQAAREKAETFSNCSVIHADILENKHTLNPDVICKIQEKIRNTGLNTVKMVSNLPYNAATPIIMNFLIQKEICLKVMVVMVQKEMAHKLTARPGSPSYSHVSVVCRLFSQAEILCYVARRAFFPSPNVDSALIRLIPRVSSGTDVPEEDTAPFIRFSKSIFNFSRKNIINAILHSHISDLSKQELRSRFENTGVSPEESMRSLSLQQLFEVYAGVIKRGI